jgi:hypothetical protein
LSRALEPVADSVLALHPLAAERYRQKVDEIHAALRKGDEAGQEAVASLRDLIVRITVSPDEGGVPMGLTIEGDLAAMLERGANVGAISVVAGARNPRELTIACQV